MVFARDTAHSASLTTDNDHVWHGRSRRRVFVRTTLAVLAAGLLFTLLQPTRYESTATVLMSAPTAIDEQLLEADIQGVAIQRRTLTGSEITRRLADVLAEEYGLALTPLEVRAVLDVRPVPETNLLELATVGSEPERLPVILENWIEVYTGVRAREIEARKAQTLAEVGEELTGLGGRLDAARDALESYRRENDIISMERQENAVLSQLDGLNTALNRAVEEEVRSKSYLDTLKESLAAGEQVVPESERSDVIAMSQSLADLRARLEELRARYTEDYIRKAPQLREIPEQISKLEAELGKAYTQGSQTELASAERAWRTAREAVANLENRLARHKTAVAEFNTIYAKHQALVEDLARLEELNRETQARQVQIAVSQVEKYPQVSVIDWPAAEATRTGPPYALLLGGSFLASILAGIFGVWLYSYLHPRPAASQVVTLSGVTLYPGNSERALEQDSRKPERLTRDST
ncbi:MAG: GumC family protein [Chromatocurvus sp.]